MRCLVKSSNERNPCCQLPAREGGDSGETAQINWEEGGDDVRSVWPLCPGLHTYYNAQYRGGRSREAEEILKTGPSSDCRLQPAYTKPESLVMAHQLRRREYVPGSCTHRPSHHGSRSHPKYLKPTARRQGPKVAVGEPAAGSPPFYGASARKCTGRISSRGERKRNPRGPATNQRCVNSQTPGAKPGTTCVTTFFHREPQLGV